LEFTLYLGCLELLGSGIPFMKRLCIIYCLVYSCIINSQISIDQLLSPPFPTSLTGSADGRTVAWVFNDKGERNIFLSSTPFDQSRILTSYRGDEGIEISQLALTPKGDKIIFVRGNTNNTRGEAANPAFLQQPTDRFIWSIHADGSQLYKIGQGSSPLISPDGKLLVYLQKGQVWLAGLEDTMTGNKKLFQSRGNITQMRWSPDGSKLTFVSDRDDHAFIGIYDFAKQTVRYIETSMDRDQYPVWSPDGKSLAYIRIPFTNSIPPFTPIRAANPWSIRLYDLTTDKTQELWRAAPGNGSAFNDEIPVEENLLWWGSGDQLIFPYEQDGWQHLYALDIKLTSVRLLTPGQGEIENVAISKGGETIFYTTNIDDSERRHIWKLNLINGQSVCLTPGLGIEYSPVILEEGIALLHSSATKPPWPAVLKNGWIIELAQSYFPDDFPTTLMMPQLIKLTATDGLKVPADLFLPPDYIPGKKYPAVIFLHGGSRRQMLLGFHYSQYYSNAYALNQYFASQGYIVLALNYRSGIGYGIEFREALNYGANGASEVRDLIGAGLYLKSRTDILPNKIALWGGSYGGYLTAHGLSQAPTLFACGVDIHGVHNWNDEIPTFAPWYEAARFPVIAKKALESSPVHYSRSWIKPVLFIHGDDDRNVPFSESVNMLQQLRKQGVHTENIVLPDEIHGFLLHRNWLRTYEATYEFIHRQMK